MRDTLHAVANTPAMADVAEEQLARLQDRALFARLVARLNDESRPAPARKSAAAALAHYQRDDARRALRAAFAAVKSDDVKGGIALAMGDARDAQARPLLQAAAKKLFGDRELKKICEEALRRLDGGPDV